MRGIVKRFGAVEALSGADFSCRAGEIHALLGENGAGKTTLMRVLFGMLAPDAGTVELDGADVRFGSPAEAMAMGVGMVHQHFTLVEAMSVAENVWLGRREARYDARAARELVRRVGEATSLVLDADAMVDALPVGLRQRLEIVKALARQVRVLVLDEPTAALAPGEADELLGSLRRLTGSGAAVVLITHKLREVAAAADRVTVLRRGRAVLSGAAAGLGAEELAAAMLGHGAGGEEEAALERPAERGGAAAGPGQPVLEATGLRVGKSVRGASLVVRRCEIVGVAAVEGNGQRELLRALAGLLPFEGRVRVGSGGVGFVPEDRQAEGLILDFTLEENLALGSRGGWWLSRGALRKAAREALESFDVRPPEPGLAARALSGGNQQKLVVARELGRQPSVLIAENPTRGLDVRATAEVHARMRRAAREEGLGVLFYSSDLDEVLAVADRVAVMEGGRWIELPAGERRPERVGALMLGAAA
jgi:simple sugar transport system ATP-binding protein